MQCVEPVKFNVSLFPIGNLLAQDIYIILMGNDSYMYYMLMCPIELHKSWLIDSSVTCTFYMLCQDI